MAKAEVEAVFTELEKVFSKQIEYDEMLMSLGLHVAQVRKQWPALYQVLANGGQGSRQVPISDETVRQFMATLQSGGERPADVRPDPVQEEELISYREWAQGPCHDMKVDEEALVDWDVESAPMPGLTGEPFTLRGRNGRSRFQVLEGNPETGRMRLKKVASLPLSNG
jgi:hypothetical protein